jgi:tRNA pseudouridine38-40 synthase
VQRYKLIVEYDGAPFVGWQRQANGLAVQEVLEDAIFAFTGERAVTHAAGRTDAGVHALAMTVHFDLGRPHSADTVRDAINHHLRPRPVAVLAAQAAPDDFHARFSCTGRRYLYRIVNRRAPLALEAGRAWRISAPLAAEAMDESAGTLIGRHDFSTFRAAQCQASSPVKTLSHLSVDRDGEQIFIRAAAPSFLHHQVRSIVGSLVQVGLGRWPARQLKAAREACDRAACGPVAPPEGLYFECAEYGSPD